jgi:hypothetical protein
MDILAEMPKFPERQVHSGAVFQLKSTFFLFCRMSHLIDGFVWSALEVFWC